MNDEEITALNADHVLSLQITIPPEIMKSLVDQLAPILVHQLKAALLMSHNPPRERKLAYTPKEAAEILGTSTETIYRLIKRGLLRCSLALRTKLIPEKEIERFLKETVAEY